MYPGMKIFVFYPLVSLVKSTQNKLINEWLQELPMENILLWRRVDGQSFYYKNHLEIPKLERQTSKMFMQKNKLSNQLVNLTYNKK